MDHPQPKQQKPPSINPNSKGQSNDVVIKKESWSGSVHHESFARLGVKQMVSIQFGSYTFAASFSNGYPSDQEMIGNEAYHEN